MKDASLTGRERTRGTQMKKSGYIGVGVEYNSRLIFNLCTSRPSP
uniref:Uncharacterized protein n=1 Tax=Rhizophora mucronata TaxID=61149 RepID=A0A2P2PBT7_RHIMU